MKVYYKNSTDSNESFKYINLEGVLPDSNNGVSNQVILSTWYLDTQSMMSNEDLNHLRHVMDSNAAMYLNTSEINHCHSEGMTLIASINIIKDIDCLKTGAALIIFQLIPKG
ncbi:MAG: hypothetical protein J6N72_05425 [Psychrobacter sp.]|nr:hypothetical protein [Psychrobacter sp.]